MKNFIYLTLFFAIQVAIALVYTGEYKKYINKEEWCIEQISELNAAIKTDKEFYVKYKILLLKNNSLADEEFLTSEIVRLKSDILDNERKLRIINSECKDVLTDGDYNPGSY